HHRWLVSFALRTDRSAQRTRLCGGHVFYALCTRVFAEWWSCWSVAWATMGAACFLFAGCGCERFVVLVSRGTWLCLRLPRRRHCPEFRFCGERCFKSCLATAQ